MSVTHGGGFDPEASLTVTELPVTGRVMTGHTADLDDPDAPIIVRQADISDRSVSGVMHVEGRCRGCIARTAIFRSAAETIMVLEHKPGCAEFAALLRELAS